MEQLEYGQTQISYSVKRGKRNKTVAINVASSTQVIVLAPAFLNSEEIKKIVKRKARWIIDKQRYFHELKKLYPDKEFVSGEEVLLSGRAYRLKVWEVPEDGFSGPHLTGRRIVISVNQNLAWGEKKNAVKDALKEWYYSQAQKIVRQRARHYRKLLNLKPQEIKIRDQKRRWASCSKNGVIRFNWRIAMLPISLVDYVVVHELCHLKVTNHSPDFWKKVSLVIPDYKERRELLKKHAGIFNY